MWQSVAREEARDRQMIMRVQVIASVVVLISTLTAWEKHPRVKYRDGTHPGYYIVTASHTIGLATKPAGLLAIGVALLALTTARLLRKANLFAGLFALLLSWGVLGVCCVEIVQRMLGRRNWLDRLPGKVGGGASGSPLNQAVGGGVWLAALASVALVASASTYVWLRHRTWKDNAVASG
jgi:hypothetical protein